MKNSLYAYNISLHQFKITKKNETLLMILHAIDLNYDVTIFEFGFWLFTSSCCPHAVVFDHTL